MLSAVDVDRFVATDALEVEEQEQVHGGHGGGDVGTRFQRRTVTGLVGFDNGLLLRGLFLGFLGGGQFGAVEAEDLGGLQVEEGAGRGGELAGV